MQRTRSGEDGQPQDMVRAGRRNHSTQQQECPLELLELLLQVAPLVLVQPKGAQRGCQDLQLLSALAPAPAASDKSPAPLGAWRWETRGLLRPSSGTGLLAPQVPRLEPSYQTPSPRSPLALCTSWKAVSDPSLL